MPGYVHTTTGLEKDKMNDVLMTQKHLTDLYNSGSNEVDCKVLHADLLNILNEEHQMAHELYDAMRKRGWYSVPKADNQQVNKVYTEYENMKTELGIR